MHGWPRSRPSKARPGVPAPRPLGLALLLCASLSLAAGLLRQEMALVQSGAGFLVLCAYFFLAVALSALCSEGRRRGARLSLEDGVVTEGDEAVLLLRGLPSRRPLRVLPGALVRCRLTMRTQDGRLLCRVFSPALFAKGREAFAVPRRGAFGEARGELVFRDGAGLFTLSRPLYTLLREEGEAGTEGEGALLLARPRPAPPSVLPPPVGGGEKRREGERNRRDENLLEHRPYIPGDDPRRINWKLYGHAGSLFVREEERVSPPHGRLRLFLDTRVSRPGAEEGRAEVDALCAQAAALILAACERGIDCGLAWTEGKPAPPAFHTGISADLVTLLARPCALPSDAPAPAPPFADEGALLTLSARGGAA